MAQPPRPLLVVYTGGTLGMLPSAAGLAPGSDIGRRLDAALASLPPARRADLPPFELVETPQPIDSSAATPATWQALAELIAAQHGRQRYAGIVVLHGTDTLAWSAASLAYQLQGIDIPVVVSGAMLPLEAEGSDALGNFEAALRFAAEQGLKEVAVCFAGKLLRATRTRKWHTQAADAFSSPNYPLLGELVDHRPVLYPSRGLAEQQRGAPRFELPDYIGKHASNSVVRIALWPGIAAWQVAAWLEPSAVQGALLEVWGGGNAPQDPELLGVLARASGEGKLLVALSQCPHGGIEIGHYAAGQGLADAGVLSADAMTPEAAFTKLVHLLAQPLDDTERRRRFLTSLAGER
ncbi:asparaginase [Franzmannia qiaohouensis]|uniref:Asparaginase n=1 Tax=Franzmannia qiaohouensis TaxID=1329370 RepID=A0ABU1HFH4_9GAMM|nr:asparaginase [Halomonas qiaohouensis]MDR5906042.1 asparaginase [Halomonas qiaohouensis]